ncbi:hypothetical protein NP493_1730g00016 [Ridgeia piscesae]|uniref:Uncharacterized protein n=1 Tax=Ridgeia piscesae TaxID=27915 RepID=A0AAD9JV49_RIDPI|nr:hypothetical protein NP493_1730g00016 [Ridgeia piscesae]
MHCETLRLNTFKTWPNWAAAWPTLLVKAGFYYTGTADQVACFCCSGHLKNWQAGDSATAEHKRYFPHCRFVAGLDSTNVPPSEMPPEDTRRATANAVANPSPNSELGVVREEPTRQDYSGETSRLSSFSRWPQNSHQAAGGLARAGFFYTGIADCVKCFSCNGTLRSWERRDDSWNEHARWFPRCNYVRTVKGEAFIRSVQATHSGQVAN